MFADTLRVFCVVGGCLLAVGAGWRLVAHGDSSRSLRCGYFALALLAASAIGTEYRHLGDVVTYRLWCNTGGVLFGLIAIVIAFAARRRA
ncbi:hypothetical protein ACWEVP_31655 [Amycolatopsis sp. NPDC003865]